MRQRVARADYDTALSSTADQQVNRILDHFNQSPQGIADYDTALSALRTLHLDHATLVDRVPAAIKMLESARAALGA